jgi:hypothetical protein
VSNASATCRAKGFTPVVVVAFGAIGQRHGGTQVIDLTIDSLSEYFAL